MKKRAKVEGQVWQAGKTNVFCEWRSGGCKMEDGAAGTQTLVFFRKEENRKTETGKRKQENRKTGTQKQEKTEKVDERGLQDGTQTLVFSRKQNVCCPLIGWS